MNERENIPKHLRYRDNSTNRTRGEIYTYKHLYFKKKGSKINKQTLYHEKLEEQAKPKSSRRKVMM